MRIVLLGPPGAGKGTQASILSRKYTIAKLSTGDMLRVESNSGSVLGAKLKDIMTSGKLVDDSLMIDLIRQRILQDDCRNGFILDGFPRTLAQANALDTMLLNEGTQLDHVIEVVVDVQELVTRIAGRYACASCGEGYHETYKNPAVNGVCDICGGSKFTRRADDLPETVHKRLESYRLQTEPLLPFYVEKDLLRSVDGMAAMDDVTNEIFHKLDAA